MDQRSQEYLNTILAKDPDVLNQSEISFLRARRDYLKKSQLEEYKSVLSPKVNQTSEKTETVKKHGKQTTK